MREVSIWRLYLLRVGYLMVFFGLVLMIWPGIVGHGDDVPHANTALLSLLGGISLLALFGFRYPLMMIPILLFELVWKLIWIISFGLPLWRKGMLTGDFADTMFNCVFGV